MKQKKTYMIVLSLLLLTIGFAVVSTTLVLNGVIGLDESSDFKIIFTSARVDGVEKNAAIVDNQTSITYETKELKNLNEESVLVYEATNTSRNYDAKVSIECNIVDDENNIIKDKNVYVDMSYSPNNMILLSGETKSGIVTAKLVKVTTESMNINIKCSLSATPQERDVLGNNYIEPFSKSGTLVAIDWNSSEYFWAYKENVTKVVFEDKMSYHQTSNDLIFDVSSNKDGSVMAYLVPNGEDNNKYTLYIDSESGVKANTNSAGLFYNFKNLENIEGFEKFDTSGVVNMGGMFQDCVNLVNLDLGSFDTSNAKLMNAMFYNCSSLESLNLGNFTTDLVTNMSAMFENCKSLKVLSISSFNTTNVTNMVGMFHNCNNLVNLDLSNFDTSSVTNMGSMFEECSKLENLDLSNFNTEKVVNMSGMFHNCSGLKNLDIKGFNTKNVTSMNSMFYNCNNLTNLDVSSFNTTNVTTMVAMFEYCSKLTNLDLSNFTVEGVLDIQGIFHGMSSLKVLDISSFNALNIEDTKSIFTNVNDYAKVIVKSEDVQRRILNLSASDRPSSWTTQNIVIKKN